MSMGKRPGTPRRAPGRGGQGQAPASRTGEFWAVMPEFEAAAPIEPAADPTALLRSLGPPPLIPGSERQLAVVVERASALAKALAMAADILAPEPETEDDVAQGFG